ncbi:MAG TPA: hypothetical protein VEI49_00275, partial [Terriglobales bacterium]|nr:hypothetical protein [Terriglobales bacterium]
MKSINSAFLALILLAYLPSLATAQATIQSTPISPTYVRPEKTLSKTVVRITGKVQGVDQPFNATGFIVVLEDSRLHNSNGF